MHKTLRRALWAGAVATVATVSTAALPMVSASAAVACASPWSATAVYTASMVASQNGHNYSAKWWTQNESPATHSGQWDVWADQGACGGTTPTTPPTTTPPTTTPPTTTPPTTTPPTTTPPTTTPPGAGGKNVVGYFAEWGVYGRNYHVKNLVTSGSAAKLTHILYAFGNTTGGQCSIGDSYADYDRAYTAAESVDGVADTWDAGALRGSFNQLRKLKKQYPNLKVIWSFGGWTWSGGFTQAAANPTGFANSCYNLIKDSRWSDVFDGIDIDWEYPNACGLACDSSGPAAYNNVISALRTKFGSSFLITSAISADGSNGGKLDAADYASGIAKLNLVFPMTYDYFGAFAPQGPTAPHSPLTSYTGIPTQGFWSDAAIQKLKSKGVPAGKMLLGIGFYGRGWTGVTQSAPGGTATGAAPGTYEAGIEDYKVLKNSCPATGTVGGTAYAYCGSNWWSYDTPATIGTKMTYVKNQGLGGAFFWEFSGDTSNGELITAIKNGLN
ncbi:glycosyl hydrolase family 18 protein [Actinoplanes sp. N902-109]|uniref:glycosyl hydrolase family 18 protein n=1 Tax=Actinoplanes sp. (strain N902-109) TaxID=649831 RepID=UPI000329518A|nr:glycosyl hydrolase family 18 protein [Actinoplanes sp. N902-109]AGL15448.1 glycoside hydrolase family 18 protein [Actinoplanes sp. N902-109]